MAGEVPMLKPVLVWTEVESIGRNAGCLGYVFRAHVPGGWLVKIVNETAEDLLVGGLTFVPENLDAGPWR